MDWVVTTGRSVEEAKERALDALGVDESDLEFEVLEEPSVTLFGLRVREARVRARVRPTRPRPKLDRRNRRKAPASPTGRRRGRGSRSASNERTDPAPDAALDTDTDFDATPSEAGSRIGTPATREVASEDELASQRGGTDAVGDAADQPASALSSDRPPRATETSRVSTARNPPSPSREIPDNGDTMSDIPLDVQQPAAVAFVEGLLTAFGVEADVACEQPDEETLEIAVEGADLGLLVGPRGNTLSAIQELTRTAVAQQQSGRLEGRLRVDIGGYRVRRTEALTRFVLQQAERVKETGKAVALEPMSPPDRKIVHDAINDVDGVHTTSRGEDRRRHVVIMPD